MKTSKHPQWALDQKKPGTELRLIRGKYYLYKYKTIYDKVKKGPKKVTGKILGRVTEDGFIPSGKRKLESALEMKLQQKPQIKEFGVSCLVTSKFDKYIKALQKNFPDHWKHILQIAYCRFIYRCPLKSIPFRLKQSYLPEFLKARCFNEKTSSQVLNQIGAMTDEKLAYMKDFILKDEYLLMDATNVFSNSNLITLSRKGYSNNLTFDPHFNLMYLYSAKTNMPVYYRLLHGNIREVKAFKNCLLEAGLSDAVIIADKGFFSQKNIDLLLAENLKFILPLKRNNPILDYSLLGDNTFKKENQYFEHEKRIIWYQEFTWNKLYLDIYLDESLKLNEEKDYLRRIDTHPENYTLTEYHTKRNTFGTIALLTNLKRKDAIDIYQSYKSRMTIEVLFDGMKNVLEADHTYMQDEQTLQGWMFVNHITLQWYQHLYTELKSKGLLKKYSVNDFIQLLTDVRKIRINDSWYMNEITEYSRKIIEKLGITYE